VNGQTPSTKCTITEANIHPLYDNRTGSHDVALLRIDCASFYEEKTASLLLDEDNSLFRLKEEKIVYIPLDISTDHQLVVNTQTQLNTISLAECNQTATDTIMCAVEDGLSGDCKIHDGAPVFFYNHEGNIVLCGVVSSSVQCNGSSTFPTVFHSMASSIDWIHGVTSFVGVGKVEIAGVEYAADTSGGSSAGYYVVIPSPLFVICCLIWCCCKMCKSKPELPPAPVAVPVGPQGWLGPSIPTEPVNRTPARPVVRTPVRGVNATPVWVVVEPPAMPRVKEPAQLSAGDPPPPTYEIATQQPPPYMTERNSQNEPQAGSQINVGHF
jgi:hypothetical protein